MDFTLRGSIGKWCRSSDDLLRWILMVLCGAGIVVAGYLSYVHFANKVVYCANYSGCELVALSEYSTVHGVPVALAGLALYVVLMGLLIWEMKNARASWTRQAFFALAFVGVVYSAYLTYLELFVILSICLWCVSSATILLVMTLLSGVRWLWMPKFRTGG